VWEDWSSVGALEKLEVAHGLRTFLVGLRDECLVLGMGMVDSGDREWMGGIGEVVAEW
jgi:hypothetical protein